MNVTTLKTNIYNIVAPLFAPDVVLWADQTTPRPKLPFVTLRISMITEKGREYYGVVDNAGMQPVEGIRECTLEVQRFGIESVNSIQTFADKMRLMSNVEKFSKLNMSCYDLSPVTDVAELLNGLSIEPRALVELNLRFASSLNDNVGIIDTTNINGNLGKPYTANNELYPLSTIATTIVNG